MRRAILAAVVGAALAAPAAPARAQLVGGVVSRSQSSTYYGAPGLYSGIGSYYGAPGYYGMGYGVPSYGLTRTYTAFSSPYGPGYGYGYAPASLLPGPYGVGLWRPGFSSPGYVYGASYYRTFPVPYGPWNGGFGPPVGYYAPGFGPPSFYAW